MNEERLKDLAASFASGEISTAERAELLTALVSASTDARQEVASIVDAACALSLSIRKEKPSASLKGKIFARTVQRGNEMSKALSFLPQAAKTGWTPMKVPGAFVKLLSMNSERGYAVALGKLDANTSYPAHTHFGPEEVLVLTGDLWIGDTRLEAGDFHHAEAGSEHDINHSDNGCTILIVLTTEDLVAQMA